MSGLTGLANLGNTCFLNSAVQCLCHTEELYSILKNANANKIKNQKEFHLQLLSEWGELKELMWEKDNRTVVPKKFVMKVQQAAKEKDKDIFTGYAQNDLPEFMLFLMDCFHNNLKRGVRMKIEGTVTNDCDKLAEKCYNVLKLLYENEYSEIIDVFYGIAVSTLTSVKTNNILGHTPEPFFMLDVPVVNNNKYLSHLYDCLDAYTHKEKLIGDNGVMNAKTKQKEDVIKDIKFFTLPQILVIVFKRFTPNLRKNNMMIEFPLTNLDMSKYVIGYKPNTYQYNLYGVCNHDGSLEGGHYTAYIKTKMNVWYDFNDTCVQKINSTNIVSPKAYCLFYRKINNL